MSGRHLGKGGAAAGGAGSATKNFRTVLHKNAASLWSRGGGGGAASTSSSTQDIARRAVEREYLQQQRKGGTKKKRGRTGDDDYYSTDDDDDDNDRAARQQRTKQPKTGAAADDPASLPPCQLSSTAHVNGSGSNKNKYRDRAKERREGKVVELDVDHDDFESGNDSILEEGEAADGGSESESDDDSDHHHRHREDGTAGAASSIHSQRPSAPVWAQTKEQALNDVLPKLPPPSSGLGREVLRWLQRQYVKTTAASSSRWDSNSGVDDPSPTRAGHAVQHSVLRFDANLSCCDPRDTALSWQVPIEMTSATDRGDAFGRPLLNRNMIRQIDHALQRRFLQGVTTASATAAVAASSAPASGSKSARHGTRTNGKVEETESGPAPSHTSAQSTKGNAVLEGGDHGDDGSAHDTTTGNNDDEDDDDIFGNVGEYNPDGSDDEEEKDKSEEVRHKNGPVETSVAQDTASTMTHPVRRTRKLFGDVLGSVPVTTAAAATATVIRPDSRRHDVDSKVHDDEGDGADSDGDSSPLVGRRRRRLVGLSEAVHVGYMDDHMDADFTGQFDDDDDDNNGGGDETKGDNDKTGAKKKKKKRRRRKSGGSDSE